MDDYISREATIAKLTALEIIHPMSTMADARRTIADILAADVVEVVRCKDCKYRRKNNKNEPYCTAKDGLSDPWDDEFCSHGERKE